MRAIGRTFLNGLVVIVPFIITVFVVVQSALWLDTTVRTGLKAIGLQPVPGIGAVLALAGIFLIGFVTKWWLIQKIIRWGESLLTRIPLIKSLYSAVRDMLQFLGTSDEKKQGQPVRLYLYDGQIQMLGILTQSKPDFLPGTESRVAVYLPMSYQIGGYTVFIPKDYVEELPDMTVEDVLKLTITAGVGRGTDTEESSS